MNDEHVLFRGEISKQTVRVKIHNIYEKCNTFGIKKTLGV